MYIFLNKVDTKMSLSSFLFLSLILIVWSVVLLGGWECVWTDRMEVKGEGLEGNVSGRIGWRSRAKGWKGM